MSGRPSVRTVANGDFVYGIATGVGAGLTPLIGDTVWEGGGRYPWDWTPGPLTASSSSAADTAGGAGAWAIQVIGLDADGCTIVEDIELNGATPVVGLLEFHRVNVLQVTLVGATTYNEGDISLTNGSELVSIIKAGRGRSLKAVYTIPKTWTLGAIIPRAWAQIADKQSASIVTNFRARAPGIGWQTYGALVATSNGGLSQFDVAMAGTVPAGTDLEFTLVDTSTSGVSVAAGFDLIEVE